MLWLKRYFGGEDYSADESNFAALHAHLGGPREMVMLAGRNKLMDYTVYLRVPPALASSFPSYEAADAPTDKYVMGLYGDQEELLRYIKIGRG